MHPLIKLIIILIILGGLGYVALYILSTAVTPKQQEIEYEIPSDQPSN